jgi:uncharacterized protein YkwD
MVSGWRQGSAVNIAENRRIWGVLFALFMALAFTQTARPPLGGGSPVFFGLMNLIGFADWGTGPGESTVQDSQVNGVTPTPTPGGESGGGTSDSGGAEQSTYTLPDQESLRQYMLNLINTARTAANLDAVILDTLATTVSQAHAVEMAANDYLSHWNFQGFGPDMRYNFAGGTDKSQENVYGNVRTYHGEPVAIEDWEHELDKAFAYLLSSSMHRANILAPEHTHVGIGLAYDETSGEFRVVQLFLNRYIMLDNAPHMADTGEALTIRGYLLQDVEEVLINLDYEDFPDEMSLEELRQTIPYRSRAANVDYIYVPVNSDNSFQVDVPLSDEEGLYHVRIWLTIDGDQILATDLIEWATEP